MNLLTERSLISLAASTCYGYQKSWNELTQEELACVTEELDAIRNKLIVQFARMGYSLTAVEQDNLIREWIAEYGIVF